MKLSAIIIFSLGVFVASCSAACKCKATDQGCIDECVATANRCIVKCENKDDNACQQACISSNWPTIAALKKNVLASATTSTLGTTTFTLKATTSTVDSTVDGTEATTSAVDNTENGTETTTLAVDNTVNGAEATAVESGSVLSTTRDPAKASASTHASGLSGGSTSISGSTALGARPTSSVASNPTNMPKASVDTSNKSTSGSSCHAAFGWSVSMVIVVGTIAWTF